MTRWLRALDTLGESRTSLSCNSNMLLSPANAASTPHSPASKGQRHYGSYLSKGWGGSGSDSLQAMTGLILA